MQRQGRLHRHERGAISVMAAVMTLVTVLATSLAVDVGRVAYVSRDQQGVTDRAALDTIFGFEEHGETTLEGLETLAHELAERALGRNLGSTATGLQRGVAGLVLGMVQDGEFVGVCGTVPDWVDQDPPMPACPDLDLQSDTYDVGDVSAVEVFTTSRVPYVFAIGAEDSARVVNKRARAGFGDPWGMVSVASTAVDLGDGLTTRILSRVLGADAELDLVGWNGLANSTVTLREIAAQLGVGSVDQVLDSEVTVADMASVIATILGNDDSPDADVQATLLDIAQLDSEVTLWKVPLRKIIVVDPSTGSSALDATIDASSLLMAVGQSALAEAAIANGDHFATIDLEVPGLSSVALQLIEGPVIAEGRPGKDADGNWRTRAETAQIRVDVDLPLRGASVLVERSGSYSADMFHGRIDAIGTCSRAVDEASTAAGSIRSDLEDAIDAYEEAASLLGVVVDSLVDLIDATLDGLGGLLGCTLTPDARRDAIKEDLHELVDHYEDLVAEVAAVLEEEGGTLLADTPVLSIRLASGSVALDSITCSDPLRVGTAVEGDAGRVVLTTASRVDDAPDEPASHDVTLLDLDLEVFGEVTATLSTTTGATLGSFSETHEFVGPFPADAHTYQADGLAIGSVLSLLGLTIDPAEVLGLPVEAISSRAVTSVTDMLHAVVGQVDGVLDRTLDVLGVGLGVVEARVLAATCDGPPRLLANP